MFSDKLVLVFLLVTGRTDLRDLILDAWKMCIRDSLMSCSVEDEEEKEEEEVQIT